MLLFIFKEYFTVYIYYFYIKILIIFFIGRKWPIITGAGFGLGMAYSNCEEDINASIRQQKHRSCKREENE